MKITALVENTSLNDEIGSEHGLSLYIETATHKILFDTGQGDLFAENARTLGINLADVDIAVLSHGHYDHGGGLRRFLEINKQAPVYLSRYAFEPHYYKDERYIGLDTTLQEIKDAKERFIYNDDIMEIDSGLTLYSCNNEERPYKSETYGLMEIRGGNAMPEEFRHEHYLLISEGDKKVLISGCSHKGILNIEEWFRPDVLVGGFHFKDIDPESEEGAGTLKEAAEILSKEDTLYYTCHCTGVKQYRYLKKFMGDKVNYLSCGESITI